MIENYIINSENSTDHWGFFKSENEKVLDIGCGRWDVTDINEMSPFYFGRNADTVIGVDAKLEDIEFFITQSLNNDKYKFYCKTINSPDQVIELLNNHQISAFKCDIEGAEYCLLGISSKDWLNVNYMAIEYHSADLKESFLKKIPEWGLKIRLMAKFNNVPDHMGVIYATR